MRSEFDSPLPHHYKGEEMDRFSDYCIVFMFLCLLSFPIIACNQKTVCKFEVGDVVEFVTNGTKGQVIKIYGLTECYYSVRVPPFKQLHNVREYELEI